MKISLCGYGTVGKKVKQLIDMMPSMHLSYIYVRKEKEALPLFTNDIETICSPEIDIVIECMNGKEPANTIIRKALQEKKAVITSNKEVVANHLDEYIQLANENDTTIQIEACVAGGIPFLDALLKLKRLEPLDGYMGIFNGTSNFILDSMQSEGLDFDTALKQAQEKGYAEADSTNDIKGIDVYYKTKIANSLAFSTPIAEIETPIGIDKISKSIIQFAKENHKVIRHIALSYQKDNAIQSIIAPCFFDETNFFASVRSNFNAQMIFAPSFDKLGYYGQGAGGLATAQAILQNVLDLKDNCVRKIELTMPKTYNDRLLLENWIIKEPDKDFVYLENKTFQEIKENYGHTFVALWR